ncbi:hypothetical protein Q31a_17180 [Aureliella helgolandensis]|uniref:DoxX n=2 Tax=Aureliella helgolandensis TaxID=2527968 RepID=A0A518G4E4_9BACT|nr:hypothetical protein Q31a_17180 [Aureliella helgolandensis]
MFGHLGWNDSLIFKIGIVEVALAVLYLIPRAGFIGATLLTAYLGEATATHVRVGDPFFFAIIIARVVWIALGLRDPRVFQLAYHAQPIPAPNEEKSQMGT